MWYAITFLVGGIPALIFYLQSRSKGKKLRTADKEVAKRDHALDSASATIGELQNEIKKTELNANGALDAIQHQLKGCFDTITDAINSAADSDTLLALVNADARRMLAVPWSTPTDNRDQDATVPETETSRAETVDGSGRVPGRQGVPDGS